MFVTTAILARLLTPDEFGLVALALAFSVFLDMIKDIGIAEALVIAPEDELEERAETAFALMQGFGIVLLGVMTALGPVAASFFGEPELRAIMPVLGLTFVLRGFASTHYALAHRGLDFRIRTQAELADVVVLGVAGIGLALNGAGAWSLVIGYVSGTAAMSLLLWIKVDWRPKLRPKRAHVRPMLGFGGALAGVNLAAGVIGNVAPIVIGRALGTAALGLWSLGVRLPDLIITNLAVVAGQVLFPAFASAGEDLSRPFVASLRYVSMLALPAAAFLAVLAEPIIVVAFGDQWRGAASVMLLFSLAAMASPVKYVCGTVLKAKGRAASLLRVSIVQVILVVVPVILVAERGLVAIAVAYAVAAWVAMALQVALAIRLLDVRVRSVLAAAWPPAAGAAVVAAVAFGLGRTVDAEWASIAVAALGAAPCYALVMWLLARDSVVRLSQAFLPAGFGKRAVAAP